MNQRRSPTQPPKRPVATDFKPPGAAAQASAAKLKAAVAMHQQGQLDRAEELYKEILQSQPQHFDALQLLATVAVQRKNPAGAIDLFERALEVNPDHAGAHYNRGIALSDLTRHEEALECYDRALKVKPDYAEALNNRGVALRELKRHEEALASCDRALEIRPDYANALYNRGCALLELKRPEPALESCDRALKIRPDFGDAIYSRGNALFQLKRIEEALQSYDLALKIQPDHVEALVSRGNALRELGLAEGALDSYDRALKIRPEYAEALNNRGAVLRDLNRPEDALDSYDRALKIRPEYAEALNNRGAALRDLRRPEQALASYDRALGIDPQYPDALSNRGNALLELNRPAEALDSYRRALEIRPDHAETFNSRGNALRLLRLPEEALDSYERALKVRQEYADALNNRGAVLRDLNRPEDALESYERALKLEPDFAEALYNRGNALRDLNRPEDALDSYERARRINPDHDFLYGNWLHAKMYLCDWNDLESQCARMFEKIERDEKVSAPFPVLALSSSPELQRRVAEIWVRAQHPMSDALPKMARRPRRDRIRIGYFSADFRDHPVSILMAELFEKHDRSRFELTAFAFGPEANDEMSNRVTAAFDRFVDVRRQSDRDVATLARNLEIDIAVDLGGFTAHGRTGIFALRAAPVQAGYLGYPGTMGAEYIDYLFADLTVIPDVDQQHYSEKIAYLPNYQVNDSRRRIADKKFTRDEFDLPREGFVFCCFNNNYKIAPGTFDCWMRILKQVEGSVLWLTGANPRAVNNLRNEAEIRGVSADRLIFAKRLPLLADHLARHQLADLFLDTLPYNAHTTASDALWAGLPVLTCLGETFAGRVAGSLLNSIHLPELVATTAEEYEALAIEIAWNPCMLAQIRQKLADNRLATPLFDTDRFARHIETAYTEMYERYQADLAPEHIHVRA